MSNTYRDNYNAKTKIYRRKGYDLKLRYPQRRNDGKGAGFVGCSCKHCRYGMHEHHTDEVRMKVRSNRREVKRRLRSGDFEVPTKFSVGYTD